jgi:hypothetical protein
MPEQPSLKQISKHVANAEPDHDLASLGSGRPAHLRTRVTALEQAKDRFKEIEMKKVKKAKNGATSRLSARSFLHQFNPERAVPLNGECPVQERR